MRPPRMLLKDAACGVLFMLKGWRLRGFRTILMYHSIGVEIPLSVPRDLFREQMTYLKAHYHVVPLRDFRNHAGPNGSRGLVAVTFDDGALDNYTQALPVLEDLGLKATFFITAGCIGGRHRAPYYETPTMNEQQVRELVKLGHEAGSHSVRHVSLNGLSRPRVLSEMQDSKSCLEDLTGQPVVSFAYPFGEYDAQACACAREAGFQYAATTKEGLVPQQDVDWWALPRVGVGAEEGMGQFRRSISPALELYEKLRGRRPAKNGRP